jgi:hypothetical protein
MAKVSSRNIAKGYKRYLPLTLLSILFLIVFLMKAIIYDLLPAGIFSVDMFKFVPDYVFLYLFFPVYYIFYLPIAWIMYNIPNPSNSIVEILNNNFVIFVIDIFLTIIWIAILFFLVKTLWKFGFNKKKVRRKSIE